MVQLRSIAGFFRLPKIPEVNKAKLLTQILEHLRDPHVDNHGTIAHQSVDGTVAGGIGGDDPVLDDDTVLEELGGFNLEDGTDGIPEVDILEEIDIDDGQDDIEELIDLVCDWCLEIVLPNCLTCKHCHVKRSCNNPDCKKKFNVHQRRGCPFFLSNESSIN